MALPTNPAELIRLAVRDLEAAEKDSRYEVNMGIWHTPKGLYGFEGDKCLVCLAGCVIAKSLDADLEEWVCPEDYEEDCPALLALDCARRGAWKEFFIQLASPDEAWRLRDAGPSWLDELPKPPSYACAPKEFKRVLLAAADAIEDRLQR